MLALDLPGYGRSETSPVGHETFLAEAMASLGIEKAAVVSPSMSGQFSFPLVVRSPDKVSAFVPVAPAGSERYLRLLKKVRVPALVVWGQQDRVLHPGTAGILQMLLIKSEVVMMQGVGHVPMLEEPERSAMDYLRFRATL